MKADHLDEKSLPQTGIVLVKASTLRALIKRAKRKIVGTQGEIDVKTTEDEITLKLATGATGPSVRIKVVVQTGEPPVYGLQTVDLLQKP